jgi:hypothetical protein
MWYGKRRLIRWVEVVEARVTAVAGVAQDEDRAAWGAPRLPDPAGTASAPPAVTGSRTWQGSPAISSSAPSVEPN